MKMNSHSRSFIKLVQHDLLALSDTSLMHLMNEWVITTSTANSSSDEELEYARTSLGYLSMSTDSSSENLPGRDLSMIGPWIQPPASQLRLLLTEMDAPQFLRSVIPLAFQSLHITHPEWGEGMLFHAHLANYIRQNEQEVKRD